MLTQLQIAAALRVDELLGQAQLLATRHDLAVADTIKDARKENIGTLEDFAGFTGFHSTGSGAAGPNGGGSQ